MESHTIIMSYCKFYVIGAAGFEFIELRKIVHAIASIRLLLASERGRVTINIIRINELMIMLHGYLQLLDLFRKRSPHVKVHFQRL